MRNRSTVVLLALSVTLQHRVASAEDTPHFLVGCRVRVATAKDDGVGTRGTRRLVGNLVRFDERTLELRDESDRILSVPRSAVVRLERSQVRGNRGKWAGIGFLVGAVGGAVVGYNWGKECGYYEFVCFDRSQTVPITSFFVGAVGAGVGAVLGHGERWDEVSTRRTSVSVTPMTNGIGARLLVRF
jgi:RNase P/RNase MRP subunit p29